MKKAICLLFLFVSFLIGADTLKDWKNEELKARSLYNQGKIEEAIVLFREIILSSDNEILQREAYYWIALAYMNAGKYSLAENNLEYYIAHFARSGENYEDALYQKGRLNFLEENYATAIEVLDTFTKKYPKSLMVPNALYWIGESLYALGRFDDAVLYFRTVVEKYPKSSKSEASLYKLKLVDHKKNELALQNLLKWSQEQYIASLGKFKTEIMSLQQALDALKKQKPVDSSSSDGALLDENKRLAERVKELEAEVGRLQQGGSADAGDLDAKMQQLEMKAKLLDRKEQTLRLLEEQIKAKGAEN